jgi:F-type H+-transporting ATPase subunit b
MPSFLQPDLQQIVAQALGFLLLLGVLRRYAWKPLLGVLDARRARIEEELQALERGRADLARTQEEYRAKLAAIHEEARLKIQEAVLEGKRIASEIQEQARAQGHAILTKSKETVDLELVKAKVMLRDQVAELTMEALERILRGRVDAKTDRHLVDGILEELNGTTHAS